MTISTSIGRELNVTRLVRRSYQLAGLMPAEVGTSGKPWEAKLALGRDLLETILDSLQAEGAFARSVNMTLVTITAGTSEYTLPETVFDCIENAAYIDSTNTDPTRASNETPIIQKDREFWQTVPSKDSEGRPTVFWTDRSVFPVVVRLWPVPDDGGWVRFQTHRLLSDVQDGNATVDLERYWSQYLLWELAHQLASSSSAPEAKCLRLRDTAAQYLVKAKSYANQNVPIDGYIDHATGWN